VEGANILTRSMIIFGQGAVRCHPYVLREIRAVADPDREAGLAAFDAAFFGHLGFTLSTAARAFWLGLTGGALQRPAQGAAGGMLRATSRLCAAFVLTADLAMIVIGSDLKRREKISGRLADILSHLYLISATVKQFEDHGRPAEELPLVAWAWADSCRTIADAFKGILANFPSRPAALLLRLLAFPLGLPDYGPRDRLGHRAARLLLAPSPTRDRLTAGIFAPTNLGEPLGRLEDALARVIAAEPAEQKLRAAVKAGRLPPLPDEHLVREGVGAGIITSEEAALVAAAVAAMREVIRVDDFPPDYWRRATTPGEVRYAGH
jgi:acyl-CoA dehydrogenase